MSGNPSTRYLEGSAIDANLCAVTGILALTLAAGLWMLSFFRFPMDPSILETHVRLLHLESTRAQSLCYAVVLALFSALCAALLIWPDRKIIPDLRRISGAVMMAVVPAAFLLGSWSAEFASAFALIATVLCLLQWPVGGPFARVGAHLAGHLPSALTTLNFLLTALIVIYFFVFLIAPLGTPLIIGGLPEFRNVDGHYAVTMLSGFDLVCCEETGTVERANYGLAMPLLSSLVLKVLPLMGIADTSLVLAVKVNQIAASVLICILAFIRNRKYFPAVAALALGMTAYSLSNVGIAVGYPNQSGIRYIPILVSLIILALEVRRPRPRSWLLAVAAATFVVLNPETGLATTAGYVVAAVLTRYSREAPLKSMALAMLRFLPVFVVTGLVLSVVLVQAILKQSPGGLFQFLSLFTAGGYGGLVDKPSMIATLLFFVATTTVLRNVSRMRRTTLSPDEICSAAFGTVILVWMFYYVNRMHEWNLWFQLVLLALLPVAGSSALQPAFPQPDSKEFRITVPMILACLIGAQLVASAIRFATQADGWVRESARTCPAGALIDGMCIPALPGTRFATQMDSLTGAYARDRTLVLSGISTFARLRGFNDGFPWYDPMEVVRKNEVEAIVSWIELHGPQYVLVDDPAFDVARAAPEHSRHIQGYLPFLVSYRESRREAGWIVLSRIVKADR